jgi:hypothetical protein
MMAILPLSAVRVTAHDRDMTVLNEFHRVSEIDPSDSRSVLVHAGPDRGLIAVPRRRRDAVLARLRGRALDGRLASGRSPEGSRLLAVRAAQITSPAARRRLATHYEELAARARYPQAPFDPRAPIARSQVDAAADEIQRVADLLRADRPVSAHGVALAGTLLTAATSPAYRIGRGGDDLAAAVARAVEAM